jgi:hypothetical protein
MLIIIKSDYPDPVYHILSDTRFLNELASIPKSNARTLSVTVIANIFFLTCVVGLRAKVSDPLLAGVGN